MDWVGNETHDGYIEQPTNYGTLTRFILHSYKFICDSIAK